MPAGPDAPLVVFTEGSHPVPKAWLAGRCRVSDEAGDLADADAAVVRTYTTVDDAWLDAAPRLKVVGRGGVGLDSIDVAACRRRGVEVVYTPDANTRAVAEFVHGLMIALVRPWHVMRPDLPDAAGFARFRKDAGHHLCDLTLGILGMGRVGNALAKIAVNGFGMRVIYHDVLDVTPAVPAAEAVDFDRLLAGCDVLSVHVDGRPENRHLIDDEALARGRFRWLVNTSRGMVIDPAAVADVLGGRLEGVALDVYAPEPPPADSSYTRLAADPRAILTPHMASRTGPAVENMSWVVRDVWRVLQGGRPEHPAPDSP